MEMDSRGVETERIYRYVRVTGYEWWLDMNGDAIIVAKDDSSLPLKLMMPLTGLERRRGLEEAFAFEYIELRGLQSV